MARKPKMAIELASAIGASALDLYAHGDVAAVDALKFLATVNPDVFAWLRDRLSEAIAEGR